MEAAAASACSTMGRLISSIEQFRPRSVRVHALANDNAEQQPGEVKKADRARSALEKAAAYQKKLLSKSSGEQSDLRYENFGDQKVGENPREEAIGEEDGEPGVAGEEFKQGSGEFSRMESTQVKTGAMASETGTGTLEQVESIDESVDLLDKRAPTGETLRMETSQPEVAQMSGIDGPVDAQQTAETSKNERVLPLGPDEIIVKIYTRDGVITKRTKPDSFGVEEREDGLRSSEETKSGQPASPKFTALPRQLSEVGKGDDSEDQAGENLYEPKVSTWGVFPRPASISKTFGGGRVIRPGEQYDRKKRASEDKMKQFLDDRRKRMGLDIPPEVTLECQKMIEKADALATEGRRTQALECLKFVLDKLVYESELHGQAALQKALCLEAMNRSSEARSIFQKLVSHSKFEVRRSAKKFLYTYKAAEKLRFTGPVTSDISAYYQRFFDMLIPADYDRYKSYRSRKKEAPPDFELSYDEVLLSLMIVLTPFTIIIGLVLRRRFL